MAVGNGGLASHPIDHITVYNMNARTHQDLGDERGPREVGALVVDAVHVRQKHHLCWARLCDCGTTVLVLGVHATLSIYLSLEQTHPLDVGHVPCELPDDGVPRQHVAALGVCLIVFVVGGVGLFEFVCVRRCVIVFVVGCGGGCRYYHTDGTVGHLPMPAFLFIHTHPTHIYIQHATHLHIPHPPPTSYPPNPPSHRPAPRPHAARG